ncbi:MAG TPA: hypothetical protein DDX98_09270 [Bacteroidales bacterium]|jgi:hypothetical protein|nr:hypothetical protein [Bacteroidales bacterium]
MNFYLTKTGQSNHWLDGDILMITINAVDNDGKFKFIEFAGYKNSGEGRNRNKLLSKADKIETNLLAEGIKGVQVNPYSLETEDSKKSNRVLIDIWLENIQ